MTNSTQLLKRSFQNIIEEITDQTNVKITRKTLNSLVELCFCLIEEFSIEIGNFYENDSNKNLSEEIMLSILSNLGFNKYLSELSEEGKRIKHENDKMEKIII